MADMNSFAAIVQNEGEIPTVEDKENETPSESQPENKEKAESSPASQGETSSQKPQDDDNTDDESKNIRFDKHPRFKELINEKNELRQKVEELQSVVEKRLKEPSQSEHVNIPNWFTKLYGEDVDAWNEYKSYEKQKFQDWQQSLKQEEIDQKRQYEESVRKWEEYSSKQLERLKDEGKEFEKNELMKLIIDFKPTDQNGNIDFDKAYEIYDLKKKADVNPAKSQAKKSIAASTVSSGSEGETQKRDYVSSKDFRGKNIFDIIN